MAEPIQSPPSSADEPTLPPTDEILPPEPEALPRTDLLGHDDEEEASAPSPKPHRGWLWQGKVLPAFWTVGAALSLLLNIILIIVLLVLARQLFTLKALVRDQVLGGLAENFRKMDAAVIRAEIEVNDTIPVNFELPVQFDLPVETTTTVLLSEDTFIQGARVDLRTGGLIIQDAPADIVLPAGTALPIHLSIVVPVDTIVPVDTRIPIHLTVPVAIPLEETELHEPFVGLQQVVDPYLDLLDQTPDSWDEALCGPDGGGPLCFLAPWLGGGR